MGISYPLRNTLPPTPFLVGNSYTNQSIGAQREYPYDFVDSPGYVLPSAPTGQGNISVTDVFAPNVKITFGAFAIWEDIEELFQGRNGTPFNSNGPREYTRRFRVRVKANQVNERAKLAGPVHICSCPGIPTPFAPYIPYRKEEWDLKALAVRITAEQEHTDDSQCWIVTVYYSTDMPPGGPTFGYTAMPWITLGNQTNPWQLPPVLEYDTESYMDYPVTDLNGQPYTDAAGRPFQSPPGVLRGDRVLTITRNERFYETRLEQYDFVTNLISFKGYDRGYAFCMGSRATETWLGPTKFWRVTYKVMLRKKIQLSDGSFVKAFNPQKVLNAGMYQRANIFGFVIPQLGTVPIIRFGQQVSQPVLLNEDGVEQKVMINFAKPGGGFFSIPKPTYMYFTDYREVDLNQLLTTGG